MYTDMTDAEIKSFTNPSNALSVLSTMAFHGRLSLVKWILESKYPINFLVSALIETVRGGQLEVVKFLYTLNDANINNCSYAAIEVACRMGHLTIVEFLYDMGVDITGYVNDPIMSAAAGGHLEVVKFLHGTGLNLRGAEGPW